MAGDEKKFKFNWSQIIAPAVTIIALGGGGLYNFADVKKDAAEREVRLTARIIKLEEKTDAIKDEIQQFRLGVGGLEGTDKVLAEKINAHSTAIEELKIEMRGR